jgi:hypothetical protein
MDKVQLFRGWKLMNELQKIFLLELERFRLWAATNPSANRSGEWECDYLEWPALHKATSELLQVLTVEKAKTITAQLLFVIAADNECQVVAADVAKNPSNLLYLAQAAIRNPFAEARWQLAVELGNLKSHKLEAERLLLSFSQDEDEYTRRRALGALAEAGSARVDEVAASAWSSEFEYQRIMALSALHRVNSPALGKYLELADADGREHVVAQANRIRRGEVT